MSPIAHAEHGAVSTRTGKRLLMGIVIWCVVAITLSVSTIVHMRSRLDSGLWLKGGLAIAIVFAIATPLAIWQQTRKQMPWPEPIENSCFGKAPSHISLQGSFSWTPMMFLRLNKSWQMETPE